jgi:hypothetical protein
MDTDHSSPSFEKFSKRLGGRLSDHATLREAEDLATVWTEIHHVFPDHESGSFGFRIHLGQLLAAMRTERSEIVTLHHGERFHASFAHGYPPGLLATVIEHVGLFGGRVNPEIT